VKEQPRPNDPKSLEALLPDALAAASRVEEAHFEFDDLTRLADARREHGEAWEMPPHLSRCSICLEMFQILMEGVQKPSAGAMTRFADVRKNGAAEAPNVVPFPTHWKIALRIAAVVALMLVAFGIVHYMQNRSSASVSTGTITLANGQILPAGAAIPAGVTVTASEATSAVLADGSKVDLAKDTRVSFRQSLGGSTTIALVHGELTAAVAKQKYGNEFTVKTPLGEIAVVGTRFSVTCKPEEVVVYQSDTNQKEITRRTDILRATRITVFEGVVRVRRGKEEVKLTANQSAVLRESEPGIDTSGLKP
jgi:hypothetical protein